MFRDPQNPDLQPDDANQDAEYEDEEDEDD